MVLKLNILFRVDSSSIIGLGHLSRCLVLAKNHKNDNIFFATRDLLGNINYKIEENSYHYNLPAAFEINGNFDLDIAQKTFSES